MAMVAAYSFEYDPPSPAEMADRIALSSMDAYQRISMQ